MSFLLVINSDVATCSTDNLLISNDDVLKLSSTENVLEYVSKLKHSEESNIKKSVEDGYEAGYKEGLEIAERKLNELFKNYLNELTANILTNRIETDRDIIELACDVTKKIAADIHPDEMLKSLAITAIQNLNNKRNLVIKVNPGHVKELKETLERVSSEGNGELSRIEVKPDQSLATLDLIIMSDVGETIASFDDQLNLVKNNMIEGLSI
jgi:flagellar biosynthesis/type III secretory pathway protein FliH